MSRLQTSTPVVHPEEQYLNLLRELVETPKTRGTRNDTETRSLFGRQIRFDMSEGFPLLTTKRVFWKGVLVELLWFLRGDTNVKYLQDNGVTIWDEWADVAGELGPVYGAQWRRWVDHRHDRISKIDQIANLIHGLKTDPYGRRHMVNSWNVGQVPDMALPPCHCLFQFYVGNDERLHLQLYQRSADIFLGVPFNIASYALLLHIVAGMVQRVPGEFIHTFGDVHLYGGHINQAKEQLEREPRKFPSIETRMPLKYISVSDLSRLDVNDFDLVGYNPHATIKAEVYA